MPGFLRQNTASQSRAIGPFLDSTDFVSPETALTIANTDVKLMANGGASADKNSGGGTHRVNGYYGFTFDATDSATVGQLTVSIVVSGALPVFDSFTVLEEAVYDALFAASAPGYVVDQPVNVTKFGGTTVTGRDIGASVLLSSGTGTGQVKLASGYIAPNWGDVGNPTTSLNLSGTTIATTQKVDVETIKTQAVTAAAGVTFPTSIASPTNITAGTITTVTNLTNAPTNGDLTATMKASVNAEVDTAIADAALATAAALSTVGGNVSAVRSVTDLLQTMLEVGSGSPTYYRFTVGALELAPTGGSAPSAATIADAVWDETRADHVGAGSFGEGVASVQGNVTGSVGSVSGAVGSVTGNVAGSVGSVASGGITASSFAADAITAAKIAADVTVELQSGLATASALATAQTVLTKLDTTMESIGSPNDYVFTVRALSQAPTGGGTAPTAGEVADAVWDEALAGHLSAGSTGEQLNNAASAGNPWASIIEGAYTAEDILRILAAVAAGKATVVAPGNGTATVTFRDITDSSDILTAQTNQSNRTSVTLAP